MYLSKLGLNLKSRSARAMLADCHRMHRAIMCAFPEVDGGQARRALGVLYRVEPDPRRPVAWVLVQSAERPDWGRLGLVEGEALTQPPSVRDDLEAAHARIEAGSLFRFRLVANPSKKVKAPGARNSKRVELFREHDQLAWLRRKGEQHGFAIPVVARSGTGEPIYAVQARPAARQRGQSSRDERLTVGLVQYDGVLEVTDPGRFREALARGVGPGKAFGCGLLSIRRVDGR